jgi:hypothetical protein
VARDGFVIYLFINLRPPGAKVRAEQQHKSLGRDIFQLDGFRGLDKEMIGAIGDIINQT